MLVAGDTEEELQAQTVEMIAQRVIDALRDDLQEIAAKASGEPNAQLTVGQVARRLGVARSTVYAHWREWGGYKLGRGEKAPIRFDVQSLPLTQRALGAPDRSPQVPAPARPSRRRRRRDLISDAPRFAAPLDGLA